MELSLALMAGSAVLTVIFAIFVKKYKVALVFYALTFLLYLYSLSKLPEIEIGFRTFVPDITGFTAPFFIVWFAIPYMTLIPAFDERGDCEEEYAYKQRIKHAINLSALLFLLLSSIAIGLMMHHIYQFDSHVQSDDNECSKRIELAEMVIPMLIHSVEQWADVHNKNICAISFQEMAEISKTKEFQEILKQTEIEFCEKNKNAVICIDKNAAK